MNNFKYTLAIAALLLASMTVNAQQNLRSAYFLDGYTFKYRMNAAELGERSFFAIPAMGRTAVGAETNLSVSNLLYPMQDGKLATFLHPDVDGNTFLKSLNKNNIIGENADLNILSFGIRTEKSFNTFDISIKERVGVNLPKDLFRLAKMGTNGGNEYLFNLSASANAYVEAAYGYSRKIGDNLSIGGRIKFLIGLADADLRINDMDLTASEDKWTVSADGSLKGSFMSYELQTDNEGKLNYDFSDFGFDINRLKTYLNYGFAMDLGVKWTFARYFTLSAAINDLGTIAWKNYNVANTPKGSSWEFDGFGNLESTDNVDQQLKNLGNELLQSFNLSKAPTKKTNFKMLTMNANAGLEVAMPFYERLTFGILASARFEGPLSWYEGRASVNIAPLRWLSLSASYAYSNTGSSFGGVLNIHTNGFNFFLGADSFIPFFKISPQFIPLNTLNTNLEFGLAFPIGKYRGRYPKRA